MPQEIEHLEAQHEEFTETLQRVSAEVLETMFFTEAVPVECEHGWLASALSTRVDFDGSHSGEMWLALSEPAIPGIAGAFLGLDPDEAAAEQRSQVIQELANILCGAVLSSLWPESQLQLEQPVLTTWGCASQGAWHACLALEEGMLAISIRLSGVKQPC